MHESHPPPLRPKTFELEQRIARLELRIQELTDELLTERKRSTALQAQLEHYMARLASRLE